MTSSTDGSRRREEDEAHPSTAKPSSPLTTALVVGLYNSFGILSISLGLPFMLWLCWRYPYLVLPPSIIYCIRSYDGAERKDGRPWAAFMKHFGVFRLAREYYDFQMHLDPALNPSKMTGDEQFIFALHPHGVLADYRILLDSVIPENFPKLRSWRTLAASVLFKFPLWRELCLWSHCIDASRATAQYAIDRGHSIFVVPGGEREQIVGQFGKEILYLKSRMGFVKLALRNNLPLVPVYVFGTNDSFWTSSFLQNLRLAMVQRLRVAIPIFWGRWGLLVPREVPIRVVFGAPLTLQRNSTSKVDKADAGTGGKDSGSPSPEELSTAHAAYVAALTKLFDDNKGRFGYGDRELRIY